MRKIYSVYNDMTKEWEERVRVRRQYNDLLLRHHRTYDAILMNIQMPELNGYEATRAIRATGRAGAKTIPIIAMTANAFETDVKSAMDAGTDAHIVKPVDLFTLHATLRKVMETGAGDE